MQSKRNFLDRLVHKAVREMRITLVTSTSDGIVFFEVLVVLYFIPSSFLTAKELQCVSKHYAKFTFDLVIGDLGTTLFIMTLMDR